MQETSDIDLLVVLPDGDPIDWRAWRFDIDEAIGCEPRADAVVAFEENVRPAAAAPLPSRSSAPATRLCVSQAA